jgi:cathepsin D
VVWAYLCWYATDHLQRSAPLCSLIPSRADVHGTVDFDTGSSDLFLPASSCGSTCSGHTKYNPAKSSTSKALGKSFSLAYGDGSTVKGKQYSDKVTISGLTATKQTLGSATKYSTGFESSQFPADGK